MFQYSQRTYNLWDTINYLFIQIHLKIVHIVLQMIQDIINY